MFVDYQNFAGSLGRNFVYSWFVVVTMKDNIYLFSFLRTKSTNIDPPTNNGDSTVIKLGGF